LSGFNEAIDQIPAEAVAKFTERLDHDADLFTASVRHDLSNPVNAGVDVRAHFGREGEPFQHGASRDDAS